MELNRKNEMVSVYDLVEKAAKTGKVDKGVNEVTKALERGVAKLVVVASDIDPKELIKTLQKGVEPISIPTRIPIENLLI